MEIDPLRNLRAAQQCPSPGDASRAMDEQNINMVTGVRSTLIGSSLGVIRESALFERYAAALPRRYHGQVLHTLSPEWLPLEVAMAHYRAAESLNLPDDEILAIGEKVGERLQGTFLAMLARGLKHAGGDPWLLLGKIDRVWSRVFQGGAFTVSKVGSKDAALALRGLPLLQFRYFRVGYRGMLSAGGQSLGIRCYAREIPQSDPNSMDWVVSWV